MRLHWLLPGLLGVLCLASPALAGNLTNWRFDPEQKQLEFTTDEGVQPRAQLLSNPARLVIDLPNTVLQQTPVNQLLSGTIRRVQVEALNAESTRMVLELAPGYSLDPRNIRFHGLSPTQWVVQIPEPQRIGAAPAPAAIDPAMSAAPAPVSAASADDSVTQVEGIQTTADGLFIHTAGARADVKTDRSRDRRIITLNLRNAVLSPQIAASTLPINRYGIGRVQFTQTSGSTPAVRLILEVMPNSPDWSANPSGDSGITLLPQGGIATVADLPSPQTNLAASTVNSSGTASPGSNESAPAADSPRSSAPSAPVPAPDRSTNFTRSRQPIRLPRAAVRPSSSGAAALLPRSGSRAVAPAAIVPAASSSDTSTNNSGNSSGDNSSAIATIQGVELNLSNSQLVIRSDRAVAYSSRWQSGSYQIILSPAQLADRVEGPQLNASSPLLRVRLRQDDNTVVISVQPASGVRFGTLNTVSPQLLALALERSRPSSLLPPATLSNALSSTNARNFPDRSSQAQSSQPLPQIRNGRPVVILDPGHGGSDVGAVGIGGIHEADLVLPVAQRVAAILEQQGVQAILTRSSDTDVELEPRVQIAEQANATLFVSIHANSLSMDRPEVNGLETYYYTSGEALAQVIHSSILQSLSMSDRSIRSARFYVLRRTTMPSVLVEIGFVTGSEDAAHLANEGWRNQMAQAIARGVLQYLQQNAGR